MKKANLFVMLLSAMAVSALASCGGNAPATTTEQTTQATTSAESATSSKTESAASEETKSEAESKTSESPIKESSEEIVATSSEDASESQPSQEQTVPSTMFAIITSSDNIVTVKSNKATAEEGEIITVTAAVIAGYEVKKISATGESGSPVLVNKGQSSWSFVMPAENVTVSAETSALSYNLVINDTKSLVKSITIKEVGGEEKAYNAQEKVQYLALVTVEFENTDRVTATGISLVGENKEYPVDDNNKASFRMVARDLTITPTYVERDVLLVANSTDHLTVSFLDEKGNSIEYASKSKVVYVRVTSADADRYSPATLDMSYTISGISSSAKQSILSSYDQETGLYHFTVPSTEKVTISMTERDAIAFKDSKIVGSYLSTGLLGSATGDKNNDWMASANCQIEASGEIIKGNDSFQIRTADDDTGVATLTNYSTIYYGENLVFVGSGNSGAITTPFASYSNILVKKQNAEDDDSLYTNAISTFKIDDNLYHSVQVFRSNALYASAFIDITESKAFFDVDFHFVNNEEEVTDTKAQYEVRIGNECEYAIGYRNEGGSANRIFMVGIYGDYINEEGVIEFLGEGHAILNNVSYDVTIEDGGNIKLASNTRILTISISEELRTYSIVDDQEIEVSLAFKGHLYRGSFWDDYYEENRFFFMAFDAIESTYISCSGTNPNITLGGPYDWSANFMSNNTEAKGDPLPQTYSYDASRGELITTIFDVANKNGTEMHFVYSAANDTFTCLTNYDNNYVTKNMVMAFVQ